MYQYKIIPIFYAKKCSLFASFIPIPKALPTVVPSRCLAAGTQSVGKRSGGVGAKPPQTKAQNIFW